MCRRNENFDGKSSNYWHLPKYAIGSFNTGGCFLNDQKSKRQVLFSYLHYGGIG